jgi:hypothetical protein
MIDEYLDTVAAALGRDRHLAQRVRHELRDHLQEALTADPSPDREAAARRAIARCGDANLIAAQLAVVALGRRSQHLALAVVAALLGVLLSMKGHLAWYGAMHWTIADEMTTAAAMLGWITRTAFWAAIFAGAIAWVYGGYRVSRDALDGGYSRRLGWFCVVSGATTAALGVSICGDAALATMRLLSTRPSVAFLVPIASILFEMVCAGTLVCLVVVLVRRAVEVGRLQAACPRSS